MSVFSDDTVSITPNNSPTPGCAIKPVSIEGVQEEIKIIDQTVDSYSPDFGILNNADNITQMFSKIGAILPTNYKVTKTDKSISLSPFERTCIITEIDQTIILPQSNETGVIPGEAYYIIFPAFEKSAGIVGVRESDILNGIRDNIYNSPISIDQPKILIAISSGSEWIIN